jgi:fumarate reductase subunit C
LVVVLVALVALVEAVLAARAVTWELMEPQTRAVAVVVRAALDREVQLAAQAL